MIATVVIGLLLFIALCAFGFFLYYRYRIVELRQRGNVMMAERMSSRSQLASLVGVSALLLAAAIYHLVVHQP